MTEPDFGAETRDDIESLLNLVPILGLINHDNLLDTVFRIDRLADPIGLRPKANDSRDRAQPLRRRKSPVSPPTESHPGRRNRCPETDRPKGVRADIMWRKNRVIP